MKLKQQETRFEFGKNWSNYLTLLSDDRIASAEISLKKFLKLDTLEGLTFIDVGCGSGLFSLAARNLGAKVFSFDYDIDSVNCTSKLKQMYYPEDQSWTVVQGSVLDDVFMKKLGTFDVVYSWGVLHHTGKMWTALSNVDKLVNKNGLLFIAIYNDQGFKSKIWLFIKYLYNKLPRLLKPLHAFISFVVINALALINAAAKKKLMSFIRSNYLGRKDRGMNFWYDWVDWVGGYPFEVAKLSELSRFYIEKNYKILTKEENHSLGCHQVVFSKN